MDKNNQVKTALLSVYHKAGIVEFAQKLLALGWQLLASGGTAKTLNDAGLPAKDIAELVGGGAILGHRVVTLSRQIHAGLLATESQNDRQELADLGIPFIDLACVDLYPLKDAIDNAGAAGAKSVLEKTDIGGPAMLRSAAKGRRIVICDPADRTKVLDWLKAGRPDKENFITALAAKAEFVAANYGLLSAAYHSHSGYQGFLGEKFQACNYGENAWQQPAGAYQNSQTDALALKNFKLLAGAAPSYNNLCDLDRMLTTITHIAAAFDVNRDRVPFIAVGVKHGNPCGAAVGENAADVLKKMLEGDLRAIFGGLIMSNFAIDETLAEILLTHKMSAGKRLLDGIAAPEFQAGTPDMLKRKGDKCRLFANPALARLNKDSLDASPRFRNIRGGFLLQPNYAYVLNLRDPNLEKLPPVEANLENDFLLAWAIGSTSNSNTVCLVKGGRLIGNGVGQQDRVGACQLAIKRAVDAGHETKTAVAYSDSFFPFFDGPEVLAKAGISAILSTSGSVRDGEVKQFCQKNNLALYLIPDKLARGFFGH